MTTCFLAPDPMQSTLFIPGGNTPANGGKLFFYQNNTTTKQTAYKDPTASVAWVNPLVLDSGGNLPSGAEVWFVQGETYTVVFAPSTDTDPPASPYWTKNDLVGMNDISQAVSGQWVTGATPTFLGASSFRVTGDVTATYDLGRRVQAVVTAGTVYGNVSSAVFATGSTAVGLSMDSTNLDAGLSAQSYGLFASLNGATPMQRTSYFSIADNTNPTKIVKFSASSMTASTTQQITVSDAGIEQAADSSHIASSTLNLITASGTTVVGSYVMVTNTVASTTAFNLPLGFARDIQFPAGQLLVNGTSLPIGCNVTTAAGDVMSVRGSTSNTVAVRSYWPPPGGVGASMQLIGAINVTSQTSNVQLTLFTSPFDVFHIYGEQVTFAGNCLAQARITEDGATYVSTGTVYRAAWVGKDSTGNTIDGGDNAANQWSLSSTSDSVSSQGFCDFNLIIHSPRTNGGQRHYTGQTTYLASNGRTSHVTHGGAYTSVANAIIGVQIIGSGPTNVSTGRFYVYGIKRA